MTTPISDSQHTRSSHDEDSAIFLHSCLIERSGLGPRGGACVREFVGFQRRRSSGGGFLHHGGGSSGGSSGGGFLHHGGGSSGGSSGGGFLHHGGGSSGGSSGGGFLHHGGGSSGGGFLHHGGGSSGGRSDAADCCTTAVAAAPAADPTDIPRLPSLARRNGWKLSLGARRPTHAGEEGRTRPPRQFLKVSVPADGRSCREP